MAEAPRHFHFVFGLREQTEPFHLVHYLCLASCRQVYPDARIHLHLRHQPYGQWWERIVAQLTVHRVPARALPFDARRYGDSAEGRFIERSGFSYAHEADFLRLEILLEHGGVYADMDTLFLRPYPDDYYRQPFLIGEETAMPDARGVLQPSLCNAVLMAPPGAAFARTWLERMAGVFDGTWNRHSCAEAARLWRELPQAVFVAPRSAFYAFPATRAGVAALFQHNVAAPRDCYSLHLWAHLWWARERIDFSEFHAGLLDLDYLSRVDTTYNVLARQFLPETRRGA